MSAIQNECVSWEVEAEVVCEAEDGLVEVGAVSETKGGPLGTNLDTGAGFIPYSR